MVNLTWKGDKREGTPGWVARTKKNFIFPQGTPALALLDFDNKGMPDEVKQKLEDLGGFVEALKVIIPGFSGAGFISRASTSSGIYNPKTGLTKVGGMHVYVLIADGNRLNEFLHAVHQLSWLNGLGWHYPAADGSLLERSIVDVSVGGIERLIFEADPILNDELKQGPRAVTLHDGKPLAIPLLSSGKKGAATKAITASKLAAAPECERVRRAWDEARRAAGIEAGLTPEEADKMVVNSHQNIFNPGYNIEFEEFGDVDVGAILADPKKYDRAKCYDPIEGSEYGHITGMFYADKNVIHSFAHGNNNFQLLPAFFEEPEGSEGPAQVLPEEDFDETPRGVLIEINTEWQVVVDGGKTRVMRFAELEINKQKRRVAEFLSLADFKAWYINRDVFFPPTPDNPNGSRIPAALFWLKNKARKQYTGLIFDPKAPPVHDKKLNLWSGLSVLPVPGNWDLMQRHFADVVTNGNSEAEEYLRKWLAFLVQYPEIPAEVALALIGTKGTGKGIIGNAICRIFGQHGIHISAPTHLTGRFNAHQRDCCFLFADETYWYGNRTAAAALQRLITEPDLAIEGKGKDIITATNRMHVMVAAEDGSCVPAGCKERRYVVLELKEDHAQEGSYFEPLWKQLDQGGLSAMLYDLQHIDLTDWHPRKIIHTAGLTKQQNLNLSPLESWWIYLLEQGQLPGAGIGLGYTRQAPQEDWEETIEGGNGKTKMYNGLYSEARQCSPGLRNFPNNEVAGHLKGMKCERVDRVQKLRGRGRGWLFPELNKLREAWENGHPKWQWQDGNVNVVWRGVPSEEDDVCQRPAREATHPIPD
jgi:hypothetical protein